MSGDAWSRSAIALDHPGNWHCSNRTCKNSKSVVFHCHVSCPLCGEERPSSSWNSGGAWYANGWYAHGWRQNQELKQTHCRASASTGKLEAGQRPVYSSTKWRWRSLEEDEWVWPASKRYEGAEREKDNEQGCHLVARSGSWGTGRGVQTKEVVDSTPRKVKPVTLKTNLNQTVKLLKTSRFCLKSGRRLYKNIDNVVQAAALAAQEASRSVAKSFRIESTAPQASKGNDRNAVDLENGGDQTASDRNVVDLENDGDQTAARQTRKRRRRSPPPKNDVDDVSVVRCAAARVPSKEPAERARKIRRGEEPAGAKTTQKSGGEIRPENSEQVQNPRRREDSAKPAPESKSKLTREIDLTRSPARQRASRQTPVQQHEAAVRRRESAASRPNEEPQRRQRTSIDAPENPRRRQRISTDELAPPRKKAARSRSPRQRSRIAEDDEQIRRKAAEAVIASIGSIVSAVTPSSRKSVAKTVPARPLIPEHRTRSSHVRQKMPTEAKSPGARPSKIVRSAVSESRPFLENPAMSRKTATCAVEGSPTTMRIGNTGEKRRASGGPKGDLTRAIAALEAAKARADKDVCSSSHSSASSSPARAAARTKMPSGYGTSRMPTGMVGAVPKRRAKSTPVQ